MTAVRVPTVAATVRRLRAIALAGTLAWAASGVGTGAAPAFGQACLHRLLATATLRDDDGFISLPVTIGGQQVSMLLDTGSDNGLLTVAGASRLGLGRDPGRRVVLEGTGGVGRAAGSARYPGLSIGGLRLPGGILPVGTLPGLPVVTPPVAGLLGADLLARFDVELDLPRRRIGFWAIEAGSLACAPPPGWSPPFDSIPLTRVGDRMMLAGRLDGQPITVLLDSGARSRILSVRAAARLGVGPDRLGVDPGGVTAGIDLHESVYHWHRFRSLTIGDETIDRPVLTVAPLDERVDLLLGADWFATRDVWISWATNRLFVRREAGPVGRGSAP